jgi:CBS domain-containing protein
MKISEIMTRDAKIVRPDTTIGAAAKLMSEQDIGFLPVGDEQLRGTITDRDIAVRAVAHGKGHTTPVSEIMSKEVLYCFEDQEVEEVARNMADIQVRRLPVVDRDKRLIGIVSIADAARTTDEGPAAEALRGIVRPGGQHSQAA